MQELKCSVSPQDRENCGGTTNSGRYADLRPHELVGVYFCWKGAHSMQRIKTTEASNHVGERVLLKGWINSLRKLGGITFLVLRDGWGTIQAITEDEKFLLPLREHEAGVESVISLEGIVQESAQAPGGFELNNISITLITPVKDPPPVTLSKKDIKAAQPVVLDHAVIANRHILRRVLLRLSASVMSGFRQTLSSQGFTEIQTPKIVASATESGANVFKLDYFGRAAYLAQSPQVYKQIMVGVFERVYEVGPVFRAEPHDTTRHINEYVSLDAEFGFIENHFTVMELVRKVIHSILSTLKEKNAAELTLLNVAIPDVPATIPHIHFDEAQEFIFTHHNVDVRGEPDLSPQDERWLGEWALKEFGSDFLFVTGYPMKKRPFYTHPDPMRPGASNSFDLLFRGTELVTGGQRLHRYEDYINALQQAGLPLDPFECYLEAFHYGMPPHGGFAIGLERLIMQLTGAPSIKLVTLFPRDIHRLEP
jgi:nondiscriminating aspartyl-tRNA synthetase